MIAFFGFIFLILVTGITVFVIKDKIDHQTLALDEERIDNIKTASKDIKIASKDQITKFYNSVNSNAKKPSME